MRAFLARSMAALHEGGGRNPHRTACRPKFRGMRSAHSIAGTRHAWPILVSHDPIPRRHEADTTLGSAGRRASDDLDVLLQRFRAIVLSPRDERVGFDRGPEGTEHD